MVRKKKKIMKKGALNSILGYFLSFHKRIVDETNLDTMSLWNTNRN